MISEMSSSEKPEFCLPTLRGSRTFWVARSWDALVSRRGPRGERAGSSVAQVAPWVGSSSSIEVLGRGWPSDGAAMVR